MNRKTLLAILLVLMMLIPALVVLPDEVSAATGTTVGTSTNANPLIYNFQSKGPYYAADIYWVFFYDGTNYVWQSSTDLITWAAKQTAIAGMTVQNLGFHSDGTYFHFAYIASNSIKYLHGTPASDGSITFGTARTAVDGSTDACGYPSIMVSSDGHVVIGYKQATGANEYPYLTRNADATSADTWTTAANFPAQISSTANSNYRINVVQGLSGSIFVVYSKANPNGPLYLRTCSATGTLGSVENCGLGNTIDSSGYFGATSANGILTIAYLKVTSLDLVARQRQADGTWDVGETTMQSNANAYPIPALLANPASGDVYVIWANSPTTNHIFYKKFSAGSWGGLVDWLDESSDAGLSSINLVAPPTAQNNNLLVAYKTKAASPYNVKIGSMELVTAPVANFTASATTGYTGVTNITFTDSSTNTPTAWAWTFGDGNTSTSQNASHTYGAAGTYTVSLNASNSAGYDLETKTDYITIYGSPTANFTVSPASGMEGVTNYTFTDTSTGQGIDSWNWSFGDGSYANTQNASHVFASSGSHTVTLNVSNPAGYALKSATVSVGAGNAWTSGPPVEWSYATVYVYDASTAEEDAGRAVTYSLTSSSLDLRVNAATGLIQGMVNDVTDITVNLSATDSYGVTIWQNWTIKVSMVGYAIRFDIGSSVSESSVSDLYRVVLSYTLRDARDAAFVREVTWNFGDGIGDRGATPVHQYANPGNYTVTCAIYDVYGGISYKSIVLKVGNPADPLTVDEKLAWWLQTGLWTVVGIVSVGLAATLAYIHLAKKRGGVNPVIVGALAIAVAVIVLYFGGGTLW